MMKILGYLSFIILVAVSCEKADIESTTAGDCNADSALERVTWLKEKVAELEKQSTEFLCTDAENKVGPGCSYIARGEFNGQTIFEIGNCCPTQNSVSLFYKCDGSLFCEPGTEICSNLLDDKTIIWQVPAK